MSETMNYKCPCCGGAIEFNSRVQKLKCPYCDTEFGLDTLRQFQEEDIPEDSGPSWREEEVFRSGERLENDGTLYSYRCESCGGEIVADETMASSCCPYCGNSVIVKRQFEGMLRPDLVIPFQLDKAQAEEKLREHLKGKFFLPSLFKQENRIQEVRGVYVPFWLYDCEAHAELRCRATRVRTWRRGDREYTETQHFLVCRGGDIGFTGVPVDGSKKMDDKLMNSIEPFDYSRAVDFETAYLAGYLADRYDEDSAACAGRANERIRRSTEHAFLDTIHGYATCVPEHTDIRLWQGQIHYALLPVWVLNTQYRGKLFTFAMNGQTGKFVGNLPMDKGKAAGTALASFASVFLVVFLVLMLLFGR